MGGCISPPFLLFLSFPSLLRVPGTSGDAQNVPKDGEGGDVPGCLVLWGQGHTVAGDGEAAASDEERGQQLLHEGDDRASPGLPSLPWLPDSVPGDGEWGMGQRVHRMEMGKRLKRQMRRFGGYR